MRRDPLFHAWLIGGSITAFVCSSIHGVWASTIRLKDDTTITGDVLRVDDDHIIVGLARQSVNTVDGKELPPTLVEGAQAPEFSLTDMAGNSQTVGKGQGYVTVLHFWIHWCPHCRSDAPEIQSLYERLRNNPRVRFITVSLDQDSSVVNQFVTERHFTYPVILASEQAAISGKADLTILYQITAFPVTYLIDEEGIIRYKISGSFAESGARLGEHVLELLAKWHGRDMTARKRNSY